MSIIIQRLHLVISKFPIIGTRISEEFLRFFVIGGTSFVITYTINSALVLFIQKVLNINQGTETILVGIAYIIAYAISFSFNFTFSRTWTFKATGSKYIYQLRKFIVVHITSALVGAAIIATLEHIGMTPLITLPLVTGAQMVINFFIYKKWVFKE